LVDRIDIAFGFDEPYVPHAAAAIASVARNSPRSDFRFTLLCIGVDQERRSMVERVAPKAEFVWRDVAQYTWPKFPDNGYSKEATLFRLGLDKLAPADCKRIIYLDTDITVVRDVRELWEYDLGTAVLAAVGDGFMNSNDFAARWHLPQPGRYFNAGVLVIDLEKVAQLGILGRAMRFMFDNEGKLPYLDQDALNWAFWGAWRPLPPAWNVQYHMALASVDERRATVARDKGSHLALVHFTGSQKPWRLDAYHPWAWVYWDILRHTPFMREVVERNGITWLHLLRMRLRWLLRRPGLVPPTLDGPIVQGASGWRYPSSDLKPAGAGR
jgi:lipopolysaccharide biosynthesis glycosyltransferase